MHREGGIRFHISHWGFFGSISSGVGDKSPHPLRKGQSSSIERVNQSCASWNYGLVFLSPQCWSKEVGGCGLCTRCASESPSRCFGGLVIMLR